MPWETAAKTMLECFVKILCKICVDLVYCKHMYHSDVASVCMNVFKMAAKNKRNHTGHFSLLSQYELLCSKMVMGEKMVMAKVAVLAILSLLISHFGD